MISSNISKKYFLIFISLQVLFFLIILGFIGLITWKQLKSNKFIHHKNNFNLTIDQSYGVRYLDMPQRDEISCFIMTTPENNHARSAIRRTWGKILKPLFVMSKNSEEFQIPLENESKVFGDMIVINENVELTNSEKLFYAVKFIKENFNDSDYFMLTRDDEYINPRNLYDFLNRDESVKIIRREISWFKNNEEEISLMIMPGYSLKDKTTIQFWENFSSDLELIPNLDFPRSRKFSFSTKFFLQLIFPFSFISYDQAKEISISHQTPENILQLWEATRRPTESY